MTETVCFVDLVVWGKAAENCAQYLSKGSMALVEGRLQFDTWQTDKGEKRHKLKVQADRVQFMSFKKGAAAERDTDERDAVPAGVEAAAGGTDSAPAPF
jgi:single-strand DNA-binding protein